MTSKVNILEEEESASPAERRRVSSQPASNQKRKTVTFRLEPSRQPGKLHGSEQQCTQELIIDGNLCDFLNQCCHQKDAKDKHVGVLYSASRWRSTVHPDKAPAEHRDLRPMSLRKLLSLIEARNHLRILAVHERIKLARTMVTALLKYHSTDWGFSCFEAEHINLFDMNEAEIAKPIKLTQPYLCVKIDDAGHVSTTASDTKTKRVLEPVEGAKVKHLFYLAILLLQIAHAKDWETLKLEHSALQIHREGESAEFGQVSTLHSFNFDT